MRNRKSLVMAIGSNLVAKVCAVISGASAVLPWLLLEDYAIHAPLGISTLFFRPSPSYSLATVMGAWAFDFGPYSDAILPLVSVASLLYITGAVISWWSPIGGVLQVGSVYALAFSLVQNDFNLFRGTLVEAEYTLGIGFHIGFAAALMTVFSLCPPGRNALMKAFRRTFKEARPQLP